MEETRPAASSEPELARIFDRARPELRTALPLVEARIAGSLFGSEEAGGLGRFRLLGRLGAGAMGVVYSAYDPTLDRGVALKLVRVAGDPERTLAEAKALARLSHPHVVPIYDVGIEHAHVYLVMELVHGETLRRWATGRDRGELLEAYRQAGEALAAAHAAGLVHRDFKPDNALVGRDGRVRVVDFGLARAAAQPGAPAELHSIAGTPRYIAPEQALGGPVTPAADQYSFCVALGEALAGASDGPVPRWIAAALERGRSPDPEARFSSMAELLRALAREPARIRRRRVALAAVAAIGVAAFAAGRAAPAEGPEPCSSGPAAVAAVWAPIGLSGALAKVRGLGDRGRAAAPLLGPVLDGYGERWAAEHRAACQAHLRGEQSGEMLDRRMACLERQRSALAAVAEIVSGATAQTLPELALAARALPDPGACSDLEAFVAGVEPPSPAMAERLAPIHAQVERARVQIAAGRLQEARALAARASGEARAAGHAPVLAEALLTLGHAVMMEDRRTAVTALDEAADLGLEVGAFGITVEAWARQAWLEGMFSEATALDGLKEIAALARREDTPPFARALLYNNLSSVYLARSEPLQARAALERALVESRSVTGAGAMELIIVRVNLAHLTDDPVRRDELLRQAEAEWMRLVGDGHPKVLGARLTRVLLGLPEATHALALLVPTCEQLEQHGALRNDVVRCWSEAGFLRREVGDDAGSIEAMERAAAHLVAASYMTEVVPHLLLWRGDVRGAIAEFERVEARLSNSPDAPIAVRIKRGELLLGLGRARRAAGDGDGARTALRAAVSVLARAAQEQPYTHVQRRLARARKELAAVTEPAAR